MKLQPIIQAGGEVQNLNKIELSDFRALFNFRNIHAGRPLDDQSNGKTSLSKNMIELAGNEGLGYSNMIYILLQLENYKRGKA